jgi:hypothetical protein
MLRPELLLFLPEGVLSLVNKGFQREKIETENRPVPIYLNLF